jgi:LytR cell envelope-related transcriptional attenuator/helix-turn-helix protein
MEAHAAGSPLLAARMRRRLTLEDAAALTDLDVDDLKSLEESRTYRFSTPADAIAATVVYASALGITEHEARELAGLPVASVVERWSLRRWATVLGFVIVLAAFLVAALRPQFFPASPPAEPTAQATKPTPAVQLPERWEIQVDVYNGTRRGNAASSLANEIAGLAYGIGDVKNADRRNYTKTSVYYPPGGEAVAQRLADELGVGVTALPGGDDPNRLVVIVGAS